MKSKNLVLFGALAVIAIVAFVMFGKGYPPKTGVEGAIGAANRYDSKQISDQDVTLQDPKVVAFLQSDLFHKIQTNPEFAKMINSEAFQGAAKSEAFRQMSGDAAYAGKVMTPEFLRVITDGSFQAAASKGELAKVAALAPLGDMAKHALELRTVVADQAYHNLLAEASKAGVSTLEGYRKIADQKAYAALTGSADYRLLKGDLEKMGVSADWRGFAVTPEADQLLKQADFIKAAAEGSLAFAASNGDYFTVLTGADFAQLAKLDGFAATIANADMRQLIAEPAFAQLADNGDLAKAFKVE